MSENQKTVKFKVDAAGTNETLKQITSGFANLNVALKDLISTSANISKTGNLTSGVASFFDEVTSITKKININKVGRIASFSIKDESGAKALAEKLKKDAKDLRDATKAAADAIKKAGETQQNAEASAFAKKAKGIFGSRVFNNQGSLTITPQQYGTLNAKTNQLQDVVAKAKIPADRLHEILKGVFHGQLDFLGTLKSNELAVVNSLIRLASAYDNIDDKITATKDKAKARAKADAEAAQKIVDDKIAADQRHEKTKFQIKAVNNSFEHDLTRYRGQVNPTEEEKDKLTTKSNQLAKVLQSVDLPARNFAVILDAIRNNTVHMLRDVTVGERTVINAMIGLGTEYDKIGKKIDNQIDKDKKAAIATANKALQDLTWTDKKQKALDAEIKRQERLLEIDRQKIRQPESVSVSANYSGQLGGVKDSFTKAGVLTIQRANLELQKLYTTSKVSKDRFDELFAAIRTGTIKALGPLTTEELKAEIALRRLINAFDTAASAGKRTSEMFVNMKTALRLLAIQQAHLAISKFTNATFAAIEAGKEFEIRLAEIQTISQQANRSTQQWSASLVQLSNQFGIDLLKTTEAGYEALSNQIAKGSGVTVFLADAFTLARTTAATAEQAVNILSSTINAYGTSSINASRYSAVLFKLADLGRVRVGELANTFGNSATLAHTMGVSIEELSAAIATLTIQGIRPDTSMTLMNNIMLKLLKPTKEMTSLFNEWGVASGEAAVGTFGLEGVLARLNTEFEKGGLTRLGEIVTDMRAIRGATGLTGQAFGKFQDALSKMKNAQKEYDAAAKLTADTLAHQLNKEIAALNNLFVADVVQRYNKILVDFQTEIGGSAKSIKPFADLMVNLAAIAANFSAKLINLYTVLDSTGIGTKRILPSAMAMYAAYRIMPAIISGFASSLSYLNATMLTTGARTGGLAAFNTAFTATARTATGAAVGLTIAQSALTLGIPLLVGGIAYWISSTQDAYSEISGLGAKVEAELNSLAQSSLEKLNKTLDKQNVKFKEAVGDRQKIFDQYVAAIRSAISGNLGEQLKAVIDPLNQIMKNRNFDLSLVGKDDDQKLQLTAKRIGDLRNEVILLSQTGDFEAVEKKFASMAELAKNFTDDAQRGFDKVRKELEKFDKDTANKAIENQLKGLSDPKKISKLAELRDQLRNEAANLTAQGGNDAEGKSNLQTAKDKIQEAEKLNNQLIAISDKTSKKGKGKQQGVQEDAEIRAQHRIILLKQQDEYAKKVKEGQLLEAEANKQAIDGMSNLSTSMKKFKDDTAAAAEQVKLLQSEIERLATTRKDAQSQADTSRASVIGSAEEFAKHVSQLKKGDDMVGNDPKVIEARSQVHQKIREYKELEASGTATKQDLTKKRSEIDQAAENLSETGDSKRYAGIQKLRKELETAIKQYKTVPNNGSKRSEVDSNNLLAVIKELSTKLTNNVGKYSQDQRAGMSLETRGNRVEDAIKINDEAQKISEAATKEQLLKIGQQGEISQSIADATQRIAGLAQTVPGAMEAFNRTFNTGTATFEQTRARLEAAQNGIIKALETMSNSADGGNRRGFANGGVLGFAGGGMLNGPMGRDNQMFAGHSGESVNSKESTAKFFSQITAMNSGGNGANGLSSNGPSVNIGDVNITMAGNNTQKNVIEFGHELRRAIRNGTVKTR